MRRQQPNDRSLDMEAIEIVTSAFSRRSAQFVRIEPCLQLSLCVHVVFVLLAMGIFCKDMLHTSHSYTDNDNDNDNNKKDET